MNPLRRKGIENGLVAQLRALDPATKPNMRAIRLAIAAELGGCAPAELAAAVQALRYAGKIEWSRLALTPSMIETAPACSRAPEGGTGVDRASPAPPSTASAGGPETSPAPDGPEEDCPASGPDDDNDYPGEVNDRVAVAGPSVPSFHAASRTSAAREKIIRSTTRSWQAKRASAPMPAPKHETEVERAVREEASGAVGRHYRARSTGTVRLPLEIAARHGADLSLGEAVGTMLTDSPQAVMRALQRKHPPMWQRCIQLGRAARTSPMQLLYAALERGLQQIERTQEEVGDGIA